MTRITNRDRLLRLVRGENLDSVMMYNIEYSIDIRGKITIWGGMEFPRFESVPFLDNLNQKVKRTLIPIYEYHRLSPYTSRIYQMEQELDSELTDERIIEEYKKFRAERPTEGFPMRMKLLNLGSTEDRILDDDGRVLSMDRSDKEELRERLLNQERKDILKLWGVDCPSDINDSSHYGHRLSQDRGMVSQWFRTEFERIGGDYSRLWSRQ